MFHKCGNVGLTALAGEAILFFVWLHEERTLARRYGEEYLRFNTCGGGCRG